MNKKAISSVVTTVLIILLAIIAVIILWAALRPTIKETAGKTATAIQCTEVGVTIESCTIGTSDISVVVSREGGKGNVDLNVAVSDASNSNNASMAGVGPLAQRTISVSKTDPNTLSGTMTAKAAAILSDGTVCTPTTKTCS